MRCWLLPAGSSLESMTELGVTPLALWGSAQVLMVLTSSSMVMERRANICSTKIPAQPRQSPYSGAQTSLPAPTARLLLGLSAPPAFAPQIASSPAFWYFFWAEMPPPTLEPPCCCQPLGLHPRPLLFTGPSPSGQRPPSVRKLPPPHLSG